MNELQNTLFDIYMKLDKEDLIKIIIEQQKHVPIYPSIPVYPKICPPQLPDTITWPNSHYPWGPKMPPGQDVWYTTNTNTKAES